MVGMEYIPLKHRGDTEIMEKVIRRLRHTWSGVSARCGASRTGKAHKTGGVQSRHSHQPWTPAHEHLLSAAIHPVWTLS